jgi:hypothetical protein
LVFKWNEHEVPLSQILALTPERPLFGNRGGKAAKSHWLVFMKPYAGSKPLVETPQSGSIGEADESRITSPINPEPHGLQHD